LPGAPGIDAVVQRRLCQQRQRVGLLLLQRGRFRGNVAAPGIVERPVSALIQDLARRVQRLGEELADLGLEPSAHDHHAVVVPIHAQRSAPVSRG